MKFKASKFRTLISRTGALLVALLCSASAQAQVTSLSMTSDPGDYIGGGGFYFYTPADGTFSAQRNYDQGVSLSFHTPSYEHWWYLDFSAPNNQPLTAGTTYSGAVRFPFQASSQAGLSVSGDGRGCNTLTGTFTVLEANYGPSNDIDSFDATYEQHCEGASQALRGEIRYNAHVVVSLTALAQLTAIENQNQTFTVSATDVQSRHVVLSATGLPAGATFIDNGNNTGSFNWTPGSSQAGNYLVKFQGDNQQGNIGVTYTQIHVIAPPPSNDDFDQATQISSINFTANEDATNATSASDDPFSCGGRMQTVWFAYTPTENIRIEANTLGSNYDTTLSVYTGARGALNQHGCNDDAASTLQSQVRFDAVAGTTYYFMVASPSAVSSANLVFNLQEAPPPFAFAPTVSRFGSVSPSNGAATVSGSVICSSPAYVTISGQIKQVHAGVPINGYFSSFVLCNRATPWSATMQSEAALFHGRSSAMFVGGKANVSAYASVVDPVTGEYRQVNISAEVTLRGK